MSDNMSHSERVRSIFDQVVDLPPTERAAALGRLCMTNNQPDAALRAEVEALLASLDAAHQAGFMSSPTAATTIRNAAITETPGTRIGPYKLLQVIGEGGFGTVFLAEQSEPVRRRVALKIIKLGMDTKQVIARFEAERQALALMDHPHIARVLDAGATPITEHGGGRPYFVMEYVVGDAITQFAANNNLDIRARLELFAQVCSAVQHAHTKGIIHRDIKPGNVLVTMTDGKPFARVIDFGIAKATASAGGLTDKTLFTKHRQLIGTPEYMSPEQAQGSPDIDTRTDVYALGVLLYELLAGDTPFDGKRLRSAAWDEMRRIIKEEDPPTPSARVTQRLNKLPVNKQLASKQPERERGRSSASDHDAAPDSPTTPSLTVGLLSAPPSVPSDLRGELDWIVMKSLDKDRARRYETPSALAADVERHLKGEAVQAAPPSAAYRLRKFVRRNKGPVIAGSAVAAALLVGIAGTTWQWREASVANGKLRSQHERVQRGVGKMMGLLSDGVLGAPIISPDASGRVMDASDPLEYAIAWGIMLAEQLKGDRDSLVKQTDAAEWSAYTANLALAQAAMDAGNWPEARERLAQCPESKRGWEWQYLNARAEHTVLTINEYKDGVGFTPDSRTVWYGSAPSNSEAFDVAEGTPVDAPVVATQPALAGVVQAEGLSLRPVSYLRHEMSNHEMALLSRLTGVQALDMQDASFSPDGRWLAWIDTSRIYGHEALGTRCLLQAVNQWGGPVHHVDSTIVLRVEGEHPHWTSGFAGDPTVSLRDLRTRAIMDPHGVVPPASSAVSLDIPQTSRRVVVQGRSVMFHDSSSRAETTPDPVIAVFHMPAPITLIEVARDGKQLAIWLGDGTAEVWDIRDPEERYKDLQAEWAERVPAGAYLDTLVAGPTPTNELMDAVGNDASLTPLRRLVAAEILHKRLSDLNMDANRRFDMLKEHHLTRTQVVEAARADLSAAANGIDFRRAQRVLSAAEAWEPNAVEANQLTWAAVVQPNMPQEQMSATIEAAIEAMSLLTDSQDDKTLRPRIAQTLALAEYRAGMYESAINRIVFDVMESPGVGENPINLTILAMGQFRSSPGGRGAVTLQEARAMMSDPYAREIDGDPWSENPDAQTLLKEAEELINRETEDDRE